MKKSILITIIVLINYSANAQATLENIYAGLGDINVALLSANGYKYFFADNVNKHVKVYNTNHSLWKDIDLSSLAVGYNNIGGIRYASDHLFNSNDEVEFLINFTGGNPTKLLLVDENAVVINNFGIKDVEAVYKIENDSFKLSLVSMTTDSVFIYSLPGQLECDPCGNMNGIIRSDNSSNNFFNYPNPLSTSTKISYSLPIGINTGRIVIYNLQGKEIKSFRVDNTFNELYLSTEDLPSGTYLYSLKTSDAVLETKKMVLIK